MSWIKIVTSSFSGVASHSIDNCFSADYTHYLLHRKFSASSGAGTSIRLRLRSGGSDATGTNYQRQLFEANSTTEAASRATSTTSWEEGFGYAESTAIGMYHGRISKPFNTEPTAMAWMGTYSPLSSIRLEQYGQIHDLATSYDGITFYPGSGTITGSVTIYGLRES